MTDNIVSSIQIDTTGTIEGLLSGLDLVMRDTLDGIVIIIADGSDIDLESLPQHFSQHQIPVIGLVVPGLIVEDALLTQGSLILGLKSVISIRMFEQLGRPEDELLADLQDQLQGLENTHSAMLVVDGLSSNLDGFIHCVHDFLGPDVTVSGFGAGYSDFVHRPTMITSSGLFENAALICFFSEPLCVEVKHGWKRLAGPFLVTHAKDNLICSINYRPALDFYCEVIEQLTGEVISRDNTLQQSASYPFGIEQFDGEFLVRDPTLTKGTAIECAGMVPSNTMIYILHGDVDGLCAAAGGAAGKLVERLSPRYESEHSPYVLVIDCITRRIVLGNDFNKELSEIRSRLPRTAKMIGLLSMGELASSPQGLVQLLNKTTVVVGIGK